MEKVKRVYPENLLDIALKDLEELPLDEKMMSVEANFRKIINSLPKLDQTLLKLRFQDEKSYHEVGKTAGFSETYVKDRIECVLLNIKETRMEEILTGKSPAVQLPPVRRKSKDKYRRYFVGKS